MVNISIIVPIYKVEDYICRCLESIIEQERNYINIECILVDDCSPDNSMNIIYTFLSNYIGKIHFLIVHHDVNKGLSCARNTGFKNSSGEYILFLDSDDYLLPNSIEYFFVEMSKYQTIDIIIGNHFDEKNKTNHFPTLKQNLYFSTNNDILTYAYEDKLGFYAWNKMVRRSLIAKNHISFVEGLIYEDILWSTAIYQAANSLLVLPQNTYVYKYNNSSIMHTISSKADRTINSLSFITDKLFDITPDKYLSKCSIFALRLLTLAVDIEMHNRCKNTTIKSLHKSRNKWHKLTLYKHDIILSLYYFTLYWPLKHIQRFSFYRHNYYRISRVLYKCVS